MNLNMGAVSPQALPASDLAQQYLAVRRTTEALCAPLSADDQMVQSTPEASPVKWHQAHTTWFFETFILAPNVPDYRPIDRRFRSLFNSYYKQVGEHPLRTIRNTFSRPTLDDVHAYRRHVDEEMLKLLSQRPDDPHLRPLVELGCNHEQQHQELILTDIKHAFWTNPLRPAYLNRPIEEPRGPVPELRWFAYDGGVYAIGHEGDGFAFDNEGPRHEVLLRSFAIASRLVTNREYLEFMNDGGYSRAELWLSDGWDAVQANRWNAPLYWEEQDGQWTTFTSGGMRELRLDEPVCHVSYYEADALARWAGARLASEAEWEIAAAPFEADGNLLEGGLFHPAPATGEAESLHQLFGDVWEWTASPYVAYPGFHPSEGALGEYNGKFMCNQMVLRGGSCMTPRAHLRAAYRNFFPPQTRWQFMGIRLANELR